MARGNQPFVNGIPELLLLRLLSLREMYGYELVREIRQRTSHSISLGEGSIYPSLHALEHGRYLRSRTEQVQGRPRVYYKITAKGRRRLATLREKWESVTSAIASMLEEQEDEHARTT